MRLPLRCPPPHSCPEEGPGYFCTNSSFATKAMVAKRQMICGKNSSISVPMESNTSRVCKPELINVDIISRYLGEQCKKRNRMNASNQVMHAYPLLWFQEIPPLKPRDRNSSSRIISDLLNLQRISADPWTVLRKSSEASQTSSGRGGPCQSRSFG